ncbi:AAA-domain-containing protein, partial [Aureobasidium melanogenum]
SVKGPELLNMYIGESEANVRRVFQRARDARPCCVFFDELDSVAPKRGNQGDSGGVMDRIVSQLLAELDGMSDGDEGGGGVFVIGATNRPDLLDQALLRPGRFDKMLYLGISDTHEKQQKILEALSRKFTLDPELDLGRVAEKLPFTYTGADLYALCSDAMLKAITRSARIVDDRVAEINGERATRSPPQPPISVAYFFDHFATEADTSVIVAEEDFMAAERELVPSVSADELGHYERVRREFEGDKEKEENAAQQTNGTDANTVARSQIAQMLRMQMQRANSESGGSVKGKGKGVDQEVTDIVDEDFVIRTDHLSMNGSGKGKGKGKAMAESSDGVQFGDAAGDDEDMYA